MKAVRKTKVGPGLELVDISVPEPEDHEVLVKVKACSMCGTDVHIYNWEHPWSGGRIKPPRTIGHEVCGEVVDMDVRSTHGARFYLHQHFVVFWFGNRDINKFQPWSFLYLSYRLHNTP